MNIPAEVPAQVVPSWWQILLTTYEDVLAPVLGAVLVTGALLWRRRVLRRRRERDR